MKNISILLFAVLLLASCKDEEEQSNQENSSDNKEVKDSNSEPLKNMNGSDSIDASGDLVYGRPDDPQEVEDDIELSEEQLDYTLGTRTDKALVNSFGEDSIDAQGNIVYPPRDTIWNEK